MGNWLEFVLSLLGNLLGIGACAALNYRVMDGTPYIALIALSFSRDHTRLSIYIRCSSFAASAVLVYAVPASPLAQPRALIGGQVFSAFIGVSCRIVFGPGNGDAAQGSPSGVILWWTCTFAVLLSIAVMHLTSTLHPPGGATALIAVQGSKAICNLGFMFVIIPVLTSSLIMLLAALLINNLSPYRRYPRYWWG